MINYEDIIFYMVTVCGQGIIVFLLLALVLDYMRMMIFANR